MPLPRLRLKVQPISKEEIEKKAYKIWEEQKAKGLQSSDAENWKQAKQLLERERLNHRFFGIGRVATIIQQPFIMVEKRMIEPFANLLDKADIFRIVEKLSPVLESAGVIMIPIVIWWMTDTGQKAKEEADKAVRAQEAVKTYLNQLSTVFLNGNWEKNERLRTLTEASTLAFLNDPNLDGKHKGQVIEYLAQLKLVQVDEAEKLPKDALMSLEGSNLEGASLSEAKLFRAKLSNANLKKANLSGAKLSNANLVNANLKKANLGNAELSNADLARANLKKANLNGAYLFKANLSGAILRKANLSGAYLFKANLSGAILRKANLSRADLANADLARANLKKADLRGANLRGADLRGANLRGADLSEAKLNNVKLCQTKFPSGIKLDPNRDCKEVRVTP
jgi:uncharacterized protein YjbI with pentapeptide repeats